MLQEFETCRNCDCQDCLYGDRCPEKDLMENPCISCQGIPPYMPYTASEDAFHKFKCDHNYLSPLKVEAALICELLELEGKIDDTSIKDIDYTILKALEKQLPLERLLVGVNAFCPVCQKKLCRDKKYCPACGQRIESWKKLRVNNNV